MGKAAKNNLASAVEQYDVRTEGLIIWPKTLSYHSGPAAVSDLL